MTMTRCEHRLRDKRGGRGARSGPWLAAALFLLVTAPALPATPSQAPGPGFKQAVNQQVAAARRIAPELGVHVVELESGDTVYSFHPDTVRIAASNTKLFTSAAALDRLGPGFFFETEVLIRGELHNGTLAGDLAIVGGGDPSISGRQYNGDSFGVFRRWAAALRERGVERIAGELVLVHGLFDRETVHPDWPRDQLTRWYEAPVSALSFNDNCVLVRVRPTGRSGRAARVEVVPPLPMFEVDSNARTTSRRRRQWLRIDRRTGERSHVLTVAGLIASRTESVDKWVAVSDPVRYFGAALRAALAEEGIELEGPLRPAASLAEVGQLPDAGLRAAANPFPGMDVRRPAKGSGWRRVLTHRTDLLTVLEVINKRSQNFYAESLLKLLGARLCGAGNWPAGVRVVEEFVEEIGLGTRGWSLADGSGMSRRNRLAPRQLTGLLRHMFFHRWGGEFMRTLPYSGEPDLRWDKRLAEAPYRGNVLAKTGSLSGVSALSGYAKARSGKIYAFSILCNRSRSNAQAMTAQDRIVKAVIDHG